MSDTFNLDRCVQCGGKIVYVKHRTGLLRMHVLPGGWEDFLCPESRQPRTSKK